VETGVWIAVILVVLVAFAIGRVSAAQPPKPKPEPKRFGLDQAEAAMKYVGSAGPSAVKAVLGVVVGVLGFENAVASDVKGVIDELDRDMTRYGDHIEGAQNEIEALKARIVELQRYVATNQEEVARVMAIGEAFSG